VLKEIQNTTIINTIKISLTINTIHQPFGQNQLKYQHYTLTLPSEPAQTSTYIIPNIYTTHKPYPKHHPSALLLKSAQISTPSISFAIKISPNFHTIH
jgi:hypothetical protein